MNEGRTTENRISWTIPALNFFMDVQHDLNSLRLTKKDCWATHVKSTLQDVIKLAKIIANKVIVLFCIYYLYTNKIIHRQGTA